MTQPASSRLVTESALNSTIGSLVLGGDVTGPTGTNSVKKINGVTVSGTPAAGKVLLSTSSTAASWTSLWTNDWTDITLNSGYAFRGAGYNVQVAKDIFGMVHVRGHMANTGFAGASGSVTFGTLPSWAWPAFEVRWIGFQANDAGSPFGGYFATATGGLVFQVDAEARVTVPTTHFCIIAQPWRAAS